MTPTLAAAVSDASAAEPARAPASRPAFVLSCERSGSTLLRWLLDSHVDIASPGELRLGRLAYDLYVTLSRTVTLDVPEEERVQATLREVREMIDGILSRYARARGKTVWCEKSPDNLAYLEALANAYPDARYVCLYRSCLDVVHSCLEVSREDFMPELAPYARRHPDNPVEAMAESWADKTAMLLAFEIRNPDIARRVRYEDLVCEPEREIGAVFEHLGCAPTPDASMRAFAQSHDAGGGDPRIHETEAVDASRIGRGAAVDVERISPSLRVRVNALSRKLGFEAI